MYLLRAWKAKHLPQQEGGFRLTSARTFRDHEDDGIGDAHEGGQRTRHEGHVTLEWQGPDNLLPALRDMEIDVHLAFEPDPVHLKGVKAGTTSFLHELDVGDSEVPSPYLLCFAHEPTSENEWMHLRASLPFNRDAWTYVSDVDRLKTEIECGIYRWLKLNGAASHKIETFHGPVQYTYGGAPAPTPKEPEELLLWDELLFGRWLRKRQRFQHQREYRFGFCIASPEISDPPDYIDIELTRSGIGLFQHWEPPESWDRSTPPTGWSDHVGEVHRRVC